MAETTTTPASATKPRIDRFELIEQLGRGTLGSVHKANDTKTNRIVALRFFDLPDWIEDPNALLQKILGEARNASTLNHPNITRLVGGGHKELKVYLASEFIEGPTLRELLCTRQLGLEEILGVAKQLLSALDHSFEKGVLHQALSPSNLKLLNDRTLRVMDFGVIPDRNIISPTPTKKIENAHYASPEQVKNRPIERASNLFTAATILYELYTTRNPFAGKHSAEVERNITDIEPFPASKAHPRVPEGISKVLTKALAKSPQERFASGQEFFNALEGAKTAVPVPVVTGAAVTGAKPADSGVRRPPAVATNGNGAAAPAPAKMPAPSASQAIRVPTIPPRKTKASGFAAFNLGQINWNYAAVALLGIACLFAIGISVLASKHHAPPPQAVEPHLEIQAQPEQSATQPQAEQAASTTDQQSEPVLTISEGHKAKRAKAVAVKTPAASAPVFGELTISSFPEGAQVQLDTSAMGVTPQTLDSVSAGMHSVTVSKAGYSTETRSVNVLGASRASILVRLTALKGTLSISGAPAGATIIIDGKSTGRVTPAEFMLDPGQHSLILRKNGYLDTNTTFNVKMGEALSYAPALKQLGRTDTMKVVNGGIGIKKIFGGNGSSAGMVRVQIKSRPKGARITINGTVVDKNTPADLQLDPGTYEVVLEMLGYKPLHKIITVAGQKLQIDEELQQY